ncbi:MAG TPA: energy-coupled thiamine transporter ThiT [Bacilli bacterium]|nr:energy-coupled thiamine transporter ThiT [Bacilli bacterium]
MKKENILKLLVFIPLMFAVVGGLLLFLPIVSIGGMPVNLITLLGASGYALSIKILVIILITLNIFAAVLLIIKRPMLNNVSLVLFILTLAIFSLLPGIYQTIDDTLVVTHDLGTIVNIILTSFSLIIALRIFFTKVKFNIQEMAELGVLIGLAIAFDFIPKIRVGATGGSISLTMLPLFIIAFRFNFVKSFIASGIVYGLLTCLFDGYGFATYPFDYLLGFGLISLTSLFRKVAFSKTAPLYLQLIYFVSGILIGGFARFIGTTLSSMIVYQYTLWAGLTYNATYIIPSVLFSLLILLGLFPFLKSLTRRYPSHD